jgi:hypothetical protein
VADIIWTEAITGDWRKRDKELRNLFSLPNIIIVKEDKVYGIYGINDTTAHRVLQENLNGKNHLEDTGIYAQITLSSSLKQKYGCVLDSFGAGEATVPGICEPSNELFGSTKCKEFRNLSSKYQRLKMICAPLSKLAQSNPHTNCCITYIFTLLCFFHVYSTQGNLQHVNCSSHYQANVLIKTKC